MEKQKKGLLGYYDYTVVLTYAGMLFAFAGILKAAGQAYESALACLMAAGICDMFDGAVAATKQRIPQEKKFGIQIDSLSDLISFGVLPGVFVYMFSGKGRLIGAVCAAFVLCALIRLAYFNVLEEERQERTPQKRKSYVGLPVTSAALLLPLAYLMYDCGVFRNRLCFSVLLLMMGAGFLLPVKIRKPGILGKVCLLLLGALEALGMLFFMGWDAV